MNFENVCIQQDLSYPTYMQIWKYNYYNYYTYTVILWFNFISIKSWHHLLLISTWFATLDLRN